MLSPTKACFVKVLIKKSQLVPLCEGPLAGAVSKIQYTVIRPPNLCRIQNYSSNFGYLHFCLLIQRSPGQYSFSLCKADTKTWQHIHQSKIRPDPDDFAGSNIKKPHSNPEFRILNWQPLPEKSAITFAFQDWFVN